MSQKQDDRSRQAIAYHWSSRIISVALEMVLPGVLGYWLDQKFGTHVVLTIVGFGLGLVLGMYHLVQMTRLPSSSAGRSAADAANGTTSKERK